MRHRLILFAILLLALLVRLTSYCGYYGSDDGKYAELAYQLSRGAMPVQDYQGPPVFPVRLGVLLPAAVMFRLVGVRELALVVYPLLVSLLNVLLAYWAGKLFFNPTVGLLAALGQALLPLDARSASYLLPDLPAVWWANLGILLLYYAATRPAAKAQVGYALLAGIALFCSWLTKEAVLYLLPLAGLFLLWQCHVQPRKGVRLLAVALSFGAGLLLECGYYHHLTGDAWYRFHAVERAYALSSEWFFAEGSPFGWTGDGYGAAVLHRLFASGPRTIFLSAETSYLPLVAGLALVYALCKRHAAYSWPGLWFIGLVLIFNFASSGFEFYRPLVLFPRYLYPLLLPALVLTAGMLSELGASGTTKGRGALRIVALLLAGGLLAVSGLGLYRNWQAGVGSPVERRVAKVVGPSETLYTDQRSAAVLRFFWQYPGEHPSPQPSPGVPGEGATRTRDFQGLRAEEIPREAKVLINPQRLEYLKSRYPDYALPDFYPAVPGRWTLLWSGKGAALYQVPAR